MTTGEEHYGAGGAKCAGDGATGGATIPMDDRDLVVQLVVARCHRTAYGSYSRTGRTSTDPPNSNTGQPRATSTASSIDDASITRLPVTRSFDSAYGPSVTTRSWP